MPANRRTVRATCKVTIIVDCGTWGDDCTMGQVTKQAEDSARGLIQSLFHAAVTPDDQLGLKRKSLEDVRLGGVEFVEARAIQG